MVRRGKVDVEATIDLHGMTLATAQTVLPKFLRTHRIKGARCVLVITGKGRPGEGAIRRDFRLWLERADASALISGYSPAHIKHGGGGAFYVFLRRV